MNTSFLILALVALFIVLILVIVLYHRLNLRLKEEMDRAQKSEEVKSTFLAHVSNALKMPLNSILSQCDTLSEMDPKTAPEQKHFDAVTRIQNDSKRISDYIQELLELSNFESCMPTLTMIEVNLAELVMSYRREILQEVKGNNVHVSIRTTLSPHCKAFLDTVLFRQLVMHLLRNAAKLTKEGSITIRYDWEHEGLRFWIENTGEELPKEVCDSLFTTQIDPYSHSKIEDKTAVLGLAISKSIVDSLHGSIEASNGTRGSDNGTTITFWIPCKVKLNG